MVVHDSVCHIVRVLLKAWEEDSLHVRKCPVRVESDLEVLAPPVGLCCLLCCIASALCDAAHGEDNDDCVCTEQQRFIKAFCFFLA